MSQVPEITEEMVKLMRDWVSECVWGDLDEEEIKELSKDQIIRGVRRNYDGGIAQFIVDATPIETEA